MLKAKRMLMLLVIAVVAVPMAFVFGGCDKKGNSGGNGDDDGAPSIPGNPKMVRNLKAVGVFAAPSTKTITLTWDEPEVNPHLVSKYTVSIWRILSGSTTTLIESGTNAGAPSIESGHVLTFDKINNPDWFSVMVITWVWDEAENKDVISSSASYGLFSIHG